MTCNGVRRRLPCLVDGALSLRQSRAVEEHLRGCAACRAERERVAATLARFDAAPAPRVDVDGAFASFEARLRATAWCEPRPIPRTPWWRDWRFLAPAGGALVAAGLTLALLLPRPSGPGSTEPPPELGESVDVALLDDLELAEDLEVLENLDALENLDVVMAMDELLEVGEEVHDEG